MSQVVFYDGQSGFVRWKCSGPPGGLSALKKLRDVGIDVTLYERRSDVVGLWTFSDNPTITTALEGAKSQISKFISSMSDFPFPDVYPVYLTAEEWSECYKSYAKHSGLYDHIILNTRIEVIRRHHENENWLVYIESDQEPRSYDRHRQHSLRCGRVADRQLINSVSVV
ncbi:Monooxygenase aurF [Colletotrichum orbiculare MAFF 240422]|uniref:Monooxygenase aurF n=1 Tax=Colletotrichum orbiculare (strain 104-T / ATCC 96160 / CBS 514.97 / LARS 414 / MAFF 240422) TaxID=1213857 RepID=A0A484FI68_COLOR|nr:Monooxygenase aurF [Colletotrichum orbiculare MAFF 240422]